LRREAREGRLAAPTAGAAGGAFVQANVAILPEAVADAFEAFCRANAQACPLLARGRPGDPALPELGQDIDIRTDLPLYRVYREARLVDVTADVRDLWRNDLVTFALGCSYTFERALIGAGIPLRHHKQKRNVAMYVTNRPTVQAGPFGGPLVVSMRPMSAANAAKAAEITARFPDQHGAPVHAGDPAALGIADVDQPDYGDPVTFSPGDVPVFWACGVTSQTALQSARLPFFIAHAPGCMLVTDMVHPEVQ
jgi:uncharacterized protein YcsI (UPF0317 family)